MQSICGTCLPGASQGRVAHADNIHRLPHLATLQLENNQLEALPETISQCPALVKLSCSTNLLTCLPPSMCSMKKIQRLDFANNMIKRVPAVMGQLRTLKEFNLRYNNLDSVYQAAADEGLSKFLSFLKQEEERENAEARERMRPIGTQARLHFASSRLPAPKLHVYACGRTAERWCISSGSSHAHECSRRGAVALNAHPSDASCTLQLIHGCHVQVGAYTEFRCKASPAAQTKTLEGVVEVDCRPWSRHGATLCKHNDVFYLFGGATVRDGKKCNDLYWLSMDTMTWHLQLTEGAKPPARSGHCAVIDPENERMVVFGGRSQVRLLCCA
jgi:hypothetical protein